MNKRQYHFRKRMIGMNVLIIVILIVAFCGVAYGYLVHISRENFKRQLEIEASGISSYLTACVEIADEIALQIAANSYVIETFQKIPAIYEQNNYFIDNQTADSQLKKFMLSYTLKANSIGRVCLFDDNKDFTFVGEAVDYGYIEKNCLDYSFMQHIKGYLEESGKAVFYENYEQDPFSQKEGGIFAVTRQIKDYLLIPSSPLGYVQVQIPLNYLKKGIETVNSSMNGYLLEAESGKILLHYGEGTYSQEFVDTMLSQGERDGIYVWENCYGTVKQLPKYGLKLLVFEKSDVVNRYAWTTFCWMLLLILGTVFLVVFGQWAIIRRTTQPIAELCELVENTRVDENLLGLPMIITSEDDELRKLNLAFNGLIGNLKWSFDQYMSSQISELQAHMFALQSQMNPHFIHNILMILSSMASGDETEKIPLVCERLSEMIRYSTSREESYALLEEETAHALNYLELMKVRYENCFRYQISYLEKEQELRVPKFIFQPLLENCFTHGYRNKEFPWQLELILSAGQNRWEAQIRDNGCGVTREELQKIREMIGRIKQTPVKELMQEMKIGGLSLRNICARLYIVYGEQMIFEVESEVNGGFFIKLGTSGGNRE